MSNSTDQLSSGPTSLRWRVLVNTGALASANLWRIVVSFLIQLLVFRQLGLEALGQYTVAMAYLNITQVLCEMGLPLWIVRELAHTPHLRRAYWRQGMLLQTGSALLLWALLIGIVSWLPYPFETRSAILLVGVSLPLFAITSATATIFQAAERLELVFAIEFVTNLLILLMSVYMLWRQLGVADLLLVVVIAQGIGMVVALVTLATTRLLAPPQLPAPLALKKVFRGALPFFGLSLNDVLLQRIDILLLSLFGDARLLGAYSAAYNLVRVAIKVLQSVWRGVYPTLARLYPTSPNQAAKVATRLFYLGFALCTIGALFVSVFATPILRLVYGVGEVTSENGEVATILSWLIWQAPLFFVELYASTWLMVIARAGVAFGLALLHLCLLLVLLPLGATVAGAMGAAWGTLAAQALAATAAFWFMRAQQRQETTG